MTSQQQSHPRGRGTHDPIQRLHYKILCPTVIYGNPRDRNMWGLLRFMQFSPVIPIF